MNDRQPTVVTDEELTCTHTRHRLMIWFWVGWNPERGQYETCWVPRTKSEDETL